jgi:hypothetical protein
MRSSDGLEWTVPRPYGACNENVMNRGIGGMNVGAHAMACETRVLNARVGIRYVVGSGHTQRVYVTSMRPTSGREWRAK